MKLVLSRASLRAALLCLVALPLPALAQHNRVSMVKNIKVLRNSGKYAEAYQMARQILITEQDNKEILDAEKELVIEDYKKNYLGSRLEAAPAVVLGWSGSVAGCDPGTISAGANAKLLQRLKYFRHMAGVPDDIGLDASLNKQCQQAALMMMANNALSHNPPSHWHCYTQVGAFAAGRSNLSLGENSVDALNGQMEDGGDYNTATGHRRWILYPGISVFGHGSVDMAMALWAQPENYGQDVDSSYANTHYVAWPPPGYVPQDLMFARWSFSLLDADFSRASVTVTADGVALGVQKENPEQGFGLNTLVWKTEPAGANALIKVTIKGVVLAGGKKKTYTYTVRPIDIN